MAKSNVDLKVMVVEDSKVTMKALSNYLKRMGVTNLLMALTGQEAIDTFSKHRPDIVLLDAILPDIDGFDIAKQFRSMEKEDEWAAIIFLTSMDKDEDIAHGIEAGGDDYLLKPISEIVLKAKINAMRRLVEMQRSLVEVTQELNTANKELQRLSTTDGLTGLANRRFFDEISAREWRRCERMKKPMSLVMVDVDHFKKYNDTYGHQGGDECLKSVAAQVARAAPRASDLAARYGGEEFVLVLGETTMDGAKWVANNIRQHVADLQMPHIASNIGHVSVSCGVASVLPLEGQEFETLLKFADEALYKAKEQGRNTVVCAE
jgi:diguanylate cyclase (GGDEF)-like protein